MAIQPQIKDKNPTGSKIPTPFRVEDWDLLDYESALNRQLERVEQRREEKIPDTLAFTEHPPVFTLGVRKGAESHLIWPEEELKRKSIQLFKTRRGGDITFHGPGQIVGYSFVALAGERRDLHRYLRVLEETVIRALSHFGLEGGRREGMTGVWIDKRKVCAIGVGVKHWITYHGFALNINTDLSFFNGIVPCGISDGTVTTLAKESGKEIDTEYVKEILVSEFCNLFYDV